jgi:trimeric autotransporter adhesin
MKGKTMKNHRPLSTTCHAGVIRRRLKTTILIALCAFALLQPAPNAFGVAPPPDGGYPGFNTAEGENALFSVVNPSMIVANSAFGWYSLFSDTDGSFNTALGAGALVLNNGDSNTAAGAAALLLNTTGIQNTAVGTDAMVYNDTGNNNTAVGAFALFNNIDGFENSAFGVHALYTLGTGSFNNAFGGFALESDETGSFNNAFGDGALEANVSGSNNTAVGDLALNHCTGSHNTALGANAGINQDTGSNNIYIGDTGQAGENNVIAIGARVNNNTPYTATFVGGIYDEVVQDRAVYVAPDGHLGTLASSRRYKEEIKRMDDASEALFALKLVTFRYKQQIDSSHRLSFGLVAEDVAKVSPDLITRDEDGQPQTVRYEAINAMLLNEFLKEHKKVEEQACEIQEQKAVISGLKKEMQAVVARLKEQDSQIRKVSVRLEASMPTRKVAATKP